MNTLHPKVIDVLRAFAEPTADYPDGAVSVRDVRLAEAVAAAQKAVDAETCRSVDHDARKSSADAVDMANELADAIEKGE